jgi:hypothetical protein
MAIRSRLVKKSDEPRQRFTRNAKPAEKEVEADVQETVEEEDDGVPEVFQRELEEEEVPKPVVRRVVVPPPPAKPDKPVLYSKRTLPEPANVELPPPVKVMPEPVKVDLVEKVSLLGLLERIIKVQEDLTAIVKMLAGEDIATYGNKSKVGIPPHIPQPMVPSPEIEVMTEKAGKPEKSADMVAFETEWKKLTFDQKIAKAKKAGVKWEKHQSQMRENINLTMAYKKHLGLS